MPVRNVRKSKVEGLYKRCHHDNWDRCDCAWWGRVGKHRVPLAKWCREPVPNKIIAKAVLARMRAAVLAGKFHPEGEHPDEITNSTPFTEFLDEYVRRHIEAKRLRSNSTSAYIAVFRRQFGNEKLGVLAASPSVWERWLNECRKRGTASEHAESHRQQWTDATYARYIQFGRAMFNWAKRRKLVAENPFDVLNARSVHTKRATRISPEQEQKLFQACERMNDPPKSKMVKLTAETVKGIRTRAENGELQKDIAASMGLSRPLISQIVNGRIWNPNVRQRNVGSEMKRRLIGAFDTGLRESELLRLQVKHVDYDNWLLRLPGGRDPITKSGEYETVPVETERLREVLNARRSLGADAYVFGKESGAFVGSFDKSWHRLFTLAGLPVGRKNGLVWHDLRHEFISYLVDEGASIQEAKQLARHRDIRTTAGYLTARDQERLRELARRLENRRA